MKTLFICLLVVFGQLKAQNTDGDYVFQSPLVHEVYLNFSQASYWDSLTSNYTQDQYMKCDVTFNGLALPDVGVKFKGNSSYNNPGIKKSFKIDFNEFISGQDYDGLKKINLNNCFKDPSFLREKLMLDFCQAMNIPSPRCTYAKVYINNTYWGLYTLVEEINNSFLNDKFSENNGNLFKGDPTGDLKWYGNSQTSYTSKYELHSNEVLNDWSDLIHLIDKINNTSLQTWADSAENVFNVQDFIRAWAASSVFANLDSYIGSGHNYFIYHNLLTNKFEWITWDVNEAFGNFTMNMNASQIESLPFDYISNPVGRPLCDKIRQVPAYRNFLADQVCYMINSYFNSAKMDPIIDSLASKIRTHVYADPNKFYNNQQFEDNLSATIFQQGNPGGGSVPGIKSFISNRYASLSSQLASFSCMLGQEEMQKDFFHIYPVPASRFLHITYVQPIDSEKYSIINVLGECVMKGMVSSQPIDISMLKPGFYIFKVDDASKRFIIER